MDLFLPPDLIKIAAEDGATFEKILEALKSSNPGLEPVLAIIDNFTSRATDVFADINVIPGDSVNAVMDTLRIIKKLLPEDVNVNSLFIDYCKKVLEAVKSYEVLLEKQLDSLNQILASTKQNRAILEM